LERNQAIALRWPPQWAVKLMNRATADNQSAQSEEEGLEPTKEWVKDLVDEIIAEEFSPPDLELHWLEEDADPAQTESALERRVKLGAVTLNEMRDHLGLDPYATAAADRPMVLTPTGYVPIEANAGGEGNTSANTNGQAAPAVQKYSPDQPRVPAGNPDGGQWTNEGGSAGPNDSRVISDASPDPIEPGQQYAASTRRGGGGRCGSLEPTPAQAARLAVAEARWQEAISRLQTFDPNWKPTPGLYETVEGQIANLEAQAKEAQNRLSELASFGVAPGPFAGESIPARGPERDFTNDERDKINRIGAETGCHTCGTTDPGTALGNFVPDHQPPSALNPIGQSQRLYPQCISCSWLQGGWVRYLNRTR
jgi:hypothetical protein